MELVKQRSDNDCGVACMAMIVGCSYEVAYDSFDPNLDCAHTASMEKFLNKHNLSIYVQHQVENADNVAHLLNCRAPAGSHWIVMDVKGNFYDPSPTPLQEYHGINLYGVKPLKDDH